MKKISNTFNEDLYSFQTTSGLRVQYLHRPGFRKSAAVLAIPFGGKDRFQKVNGKMIEHPLGIAHFLEHKVFDEEGVDVLEVLTELGASANAFTSYYETMYYFSHPQELKASLTLLMQFVRRFDIDEASVEKEKPIIIEELKMYEQIPVMRLLQEIKSSVYQEHGYKYDIAGTVESVQATSLENLQKAYRYNYADERMVLSVIAPDEPKEVQAMLEDLCRKYPPQIEKADHVMAVEAKESYHVVQKEKEIRSHFKNDRIAIAYKFAFETEEADLDEEKIDLILELNFSSLHEDYQEALDEGIISNNFAYMSDVDAGVALIYFFNDSKNQDAFLAWVDKKMKNLVLDKEDFESIRRKNFGQMIFELANFDHLAVEMARKQLKGSNYFASMEAMSQIDLNDLEDLLNRLGKYEKAIVKLKGETSTE